MLNWNGPAVIEKAQSAAIRAINRTMAETVVQAKNNHPGWKNVTSAAEGSVQVVQFAETQSNGVTRGRWGSVGVGYVLWLELKHGAFLRRAADVVYPRLPHYIKEYFK
jgi:hypothetical protein